MSETIAERVLLRAPLMQEVRLLLQAPKQQENGDWLCEVAVEGLSGGRLPYAYGIDSFQAVELAIRNVDAWLTTLPDFRNGLLFYRDGSPYAPQSPLEDKEEK